MFIYLYIYYLFKYVKNKIIKYKNKKAVGEEYYLMLLGINKLMESNSKEYREKLKTTPKPCIPYLGLFQSDLTFIYDGNPDRIENGLINYGKMKKIAETIMNIQSYQNDQFAYVDNPEIQEKLLAQINLVDNLTDEEVYERSISLEPRNLVSQVEVPWMIN